MCWLKGLVVPYDSRQLTARMLDAFGCAFAMLIGYPIRGVGQHQRGMLWQNERATVTMINSDACMVVVGCNHMPGVPCGTASSGASSAITSASARSGL